ncbi:MAG: thioredoxin domain-containing protein [Ginsengibacter sp.]
MHTNSLIHETSPYLLQHSRNPVNWFAWNDETLKKAKAEDKMILISIGYAACHWCHVMERESFENQDVAKVMNEHFICIKVDREERPDVDQVYMDAAYLINGNGGWPLNALALPDGKPFFAGTYYPKGNWIKLLEYFADIYKNEKGKLQEQADHLSKGIVAMEEFPVAESQSSLQEENLQSMVEQLESRIDKIHGGTLGSMKFPMPSVWEFLLQYNQHYQNNIAFDGVETTLTNMAISGIYDQVGGGFSRYATDAHWHVPHFEKMLYDNGQLVSLYSHAYQKTQNQLYQRIVFETIEFVKRELLSAERGFYSSLDADSEGEEGKFYVWTKQEIEDVLKDDAEFYFERYGISSAGNWEHQKNIPDINFGEADVAKKFEMSEEDLEKKCAHLNSLLLEAREKRVRPATDDKILTSWNSLMTIGFIDAYRAFAETSFLNVARENIDFLLSSVLNPDHSLFRNYKNGRASIPAFLDDYAFLITALIEFYQVSFEESYLKTAQKLMQYCIENFYDFEKDIFYYTDKNHNKLIVRKTEITDNVIPSSNSEMAKNLFKIGMYFDDAEYQNLSLKMIRNQWPSIIKNAGYYSNWAIAALYHIQPTFEIAVVGKDWKDKLGELQKEYLPNALFAGGADEGSIPLLENKLVKNKTNIYVCKNKNCQLPVEETNLAIEQIRQNKIK